MMVNINSIDRESTYGLVDFLTISRLREYDESSSGTNQYVSPSDGTSKSDSHLQFSISFLRLPLYKNV